MSASIKHTHSNDDTPQMTAFVEPDSYESAEFCVTLGAKLENFKLLPAFIFFVQFFTICRELEIEETHPKTTRGVDH